MFGVQPSLSIGLWQAWLCVTANLVTSRCLRKPHQVKYGLPVDVRLQISKSSSNSGSNSSSNNNIDKAAATTTTNKNNSNDNYNDIDIDWSIYVWQYMSLLAIRERIRTNRGQTLSWICPWYALIIHTYHYLLLLHWIRGLRRKPCNKHATSNN